MKRNMYYVGLVLFFVLLGEGVARILGMVDFPIYEANSEIGYIPAANQSGQFLNKNDWQFNSLHMGAREFEPSEKPDWLLVGDSIVYGGNNYAGPERLGPSLQEVLGGSVSVWPVSAGSWGLRNELAWVIKHPEVISKVDQVIFIVNSGDFGKASAWSCELTHPQNRPLSALWYLANKYIYAFTPCDEVPPDLQVAYVDLHVVLADYLERYEKKTFFVIYPNINELHGSGVIEREFAAGLELLESNGAKVLYISKHPAWKADFYRDSIHPTPNGNRVLATILAEMLAKETESTAQMAGGEVQ